MAFDSSTTAWLLASDPAIAWQTQRDLLDLPESTWSQTRARVEREGWGAQLLSHQDPDGQWAGAAFWPAEVGQAEWEREGQPWTATAHSLWLLREFGLDPAGTAAQRTRDLVGENSRWDEGAQPFWDGEVEECINGRALALGVYFGAPVDPILATLLADVQPDGGWNCERANGSQVSSMDTTINVIEGLLAYEVAHPERTDLRPIRETGEEYLLQRHLFHKLSDGSIADESFLKLTHPVFWQLTILRALDHFRAASLAHGTAPDPRLAEAIDLIRTRQLPDGRWPADGRARGRVWFELEGPEGTPSPWNTLVALRVLRWWDQHQPEQLITTQP